MSSFFHRALGIVSAIGGALALLPDTLPAGKLKSAIGVGALVGAFATNLLKVRNKPQQTAE